MAGMKRSFVSSSIISSNNDDNDNNDDTPEQQQQQQRQRMTTSDSFEKRTERIPERYLPNQGYLKVKKVSQSVILYKDQPLVDRITSKTRVGKVHHTETNWRKYDHIHFENGWHYIHIQLSIEEQYQSDVKYGWCLFEDIRIAQTKYGFKFKDGYDTHPGRFNFYLKPVILISLFDGIGGARVAMDRIKDRFNILRSFVCENDAYAKAIHDRHWKGKDSVDLGDIECITKATIESRIYNDRYVKEYRTLAPHYDSLHYIVIAGPPCQDLSQAGNQAGILGKSSKLFFHVPRIIHTLIDMLGGESRNVHFIVENVEMPTKDERMFTKFLGHVIDCHIREMIQPCRVDFNKGGCCSSLMSRRRLYWCSSVYEGRDIGLDDFRRNKCLHNSLLVGNNNSRETLCDVLKRHGYPDYEYFDKDTGQSVSYLPTMTRNKDNVGQSRYYIRKIQDVHDDEENYNPTKQVFIEGPQSINEDLMGFPIGYTDASMECIAKKKLDDSKRRELLGNSFMIFHIQYFLIQIHESTLPEPEFHLTKIVLNPKDVCKGEFSQKKLTNKQQYEEIYEELKQMELSQLEKQQDMCKYYKYKKK